MIDLGSIVTIFCFCWSFIGDYGNQFFKKYLMKRYFVCGLLWSNRSRFRLCCTSSFYICVDFYLTQFLPYICICFSSTKVGTKTIYKTISKTISFLVLKVTGSLKCILKCKKYQIFSILKTKSQHNIKHKQDNH